MFNRKAYTLVTAPSVEPVALADAKTFLRVDGTADDALITSLIATARRAAEEYTKRAFITQTWLLTLDAFPCCDRTTWGEIIPSYLRATPEIQLSRQPIQSIASIKTRDIANAQTTVDAAVYSLDTAGGRIFLNKGQSWPSSLRSQAAIEVTFIAGYGDSADKVPSPIVQAILQYVNAMYESKTCSDMPDGCKTLLSAFMLPEAFGVM